MKKMTLLLSVMLWAVIGYGAARAQDYGAMDTLQSALENNRTNQTSTWVNPDTGGTGTVAPVRTFQNTQGEPCREFQQTIVIGGREEMGYGTACRQPDGTWRIVAAETDVKAASSAEQPATVYVREVVRPYRVVRPYYYPYDPYYYEPWGYGYPYWYPWSFSLNLGYLYLDHGHRHGGHHGHHGWHRGGWDHDRGHFDRGHHRGGHRR